MTEMPSQIARIEAHIRRRLRAKIVSQQKQKRNLVKLLISKGVDRKRAFIDVYAKSHGVWALSHTKAMEQAFPNVWFDKIGFQIFSDKKLPHWKSPREWIKLI